MKSTALVSDGRNVELYNRLYLAAFEHPRPARTTFVSPLERVQVELECQAYLGS